MRVDSPPQSDEEVDRKGNRIAVGKGSAYDLFLTRELASAEIARAAVVQEPASQQLSL